MAEKTLNEVLLETKEIINKILVIIEKEEREKKIEKLMTALLICLLTFASITIVCEILKLFIK